MWAWGKIENIGLIWLRSKIDCKKETDGKMNEVLACFGVLFFILVIFFIGFSVGFDDCEKSHKSWPIETELEVKDE